MATLEPYEEEQDPSRFDDQDDGNAKINKVLENQTMLNALASDLGDIYGERPVLPGKG